MTSLYLWMAALAGLWFSVEKPVEPAASGVPKKNLACPCLYQFASPDPFCLIEEYNSNDGYSCYDYVRAAIEYGWIDRNCGRRSPSGQFININQNVPNGPITGDNKYIPVCNENQAEVISYTGHAVLKLWGSTPYASKASDIDPLYIHTQPGVIGGGGPPQYSVYVGSINAATSAISPGSQRTFSIKHVNGLTYSWSFSAAYWDVVGGSANSASVTLLAKCPSHVSGNQNTAVSVTVSTSCGSRTQSVNIPVSCPISYCTGTYLRNGSSTVYTLNSYNGNPAGGITTTMAGSSGVAYIWTKTSGANVYWYTFGTGNRQMYISLSSGQSAGFNISASTGCSRSVVYVATSFRPGPQQGSDPAQAAAGLDDGVAGLAGSVSVYPNPVRSVLHLEAAPELAGQAFRILSPQGATVYQGALEAGTMQIRLEALPAGIYFLQAPSWSLKFLKE